MCLRIPFSVSGFILSKRSNQWILFQTYSELLEVDAFCVFYMNGKTFLYDSASRWFCIFPFRKCSVHCKQIGKALTFLTRFPYKYCIRRRFNRRKFFCRFKKLAYRLGHAPLNFQYIHTEPYIIILCTLFVSDDSCLCDWRSSFRNGRLRFLWSVDGRKYAKNLLFQKLCFPLNYLSSVYDLHSHGFLF